MLLSDVKIAKHSFSGPTKSIEQFHPGVVAVFPGHRVDVGAMRTVLSDPHILPALPVVMAESQSMET